MSGCREFECFFVASDFITETLRLDDFADQELKRVISVLAVLCTRLDIRDVVLLCKLLSCMLVNLDIIHLIYLVRKNDDLRVRVSIGTDLR